MPFGTTRWSVIAACAKEQKSDDETAQAALNQLCCDYWPPLYSFVRRRGYNSADAQDLVQGFFAYFLEHRAYAKTDRAKGKFRSFLLASIKHYLADVWDRERAVKRGGAHEFVLVDEAIAAIETQWLDNPNAVKLDEEQYYERRWAEALVAHALARLAREFASEAKQRLYGELKPFLCGGTALPTQQQVAARLQLPIETLRSHLSRMRSRYRELLREEIGRTISDTDDVDEELRQLGRVLTRSL